MNKAPSDGSAPRKRSAAAEASEWTPELRRAVCYHEAGHAVGALVAGVPVFRVFLCVEGVEYVPDISQAKPLPLPLGLPAQIRRGGIDWDFGVLNDRPMSDEERFADYCIAHLAGPAAEVKAVGILPYKVLSLHEHVDELRRIGLANVEEFIAHAKRFVKVNWRPISLVADALDRKNVLTSDDLNSILDGVPIAS